MPFFWRGRFTFARKRETFFCVYFPPSFLVFLCFLCFLGVFLCFCGVLFVLFGCFWFSRVSAKKQMVFFRRGDEQNREFPLWIGPIVPYTRKRTETLRDAARAKFPVDVLWPPCAARFRVYIYYYRAACAPFREMRDAQRRGDSSRLAQRRALTYSTHT